jgi:hypothetical protein
MLINRIANPTQGSGSARRRAGWLLAVGLVIGGIFAAAPANANGGFSQADSVRITSGCEGPDREHILCGS